MSFHKQPKGGGQYLRGAKSAALVLSFLMVLLWGNISYAQNYHDAESKELGEKYGLTITKGIRGERLEFKMSQAMQIVAGLNNLGLVTLNEKFIMREGRVPISFEDLVRFRKVIIAAGGWDENVPIEGFISDLKEYDNLVVTTDKDDNDIYKVDAYLQVYWTALEDLQKE